jgi:hypothetical protein
MLPVAALAVLLALLQPAPAAPMRILFIGNSLTYVNDVPGMVCTLARSTGRKVVCETLAQPDFSLEDHWRGDARRTIARGWDVVVLQQGPSALRESRALLIDFTRRFDAEIRKAGARTALYMVWPSRQRRGDFAAVGESYAAAARAVNGTLLPAGDAWLAAWSADSTLPLYGADGFHPSPMGSYLAAMTIYRQLFGPVPATPVLGGTAAEAPVLQQAVEHAVQRVMKEP